MLDTDYEVLASSNLEVEADPKIVNIQKTACVRSPPKPASSGKGAFAEKMNRRHKSHEFDGLPFYLKRSLMTISELEEDDRTTVHGVCLCYSNIICRGLIQGKIMNISLLFILQLLKLIRKTGGRGLK